MKYHSHRAEPYFTFLKNGQKTIEGRVRNGKYKHIKPDDTIKVLNNEETDNVEVLVKRVAVYPSTKAMLENEPIKKLLPDVDTIDEAIKIYKRFYTPEQELQFGMVAIEVERKL